MVVPAQSKTRDHGFRAWASVLALLVEALLLLRLEGVSLTSLALDGFLQFPLDEINEVIAVTCQPCLGKSSKERA